jgi:sRNA-binding carbon storage regulator CsrA
MVCGIRDWRVRIGIEAPQSVTVLREEIVRREPDAGEEPYCWFTRG